MTVDAGAGRTAGDATLPSATVDRVLRRASELARQDQVPSVDHGVGEASLIAAADEIGLPVAAVRRALAVERLGPLPEGRAVDRMFGEAVVVVDDELPGSVPDVLDRLDAWMVDGHHLRRERRRADGSGGSVEWSKRSGVVGVAMRTIRGATGEGRLGELRRVTAVASDTGEGSCAVRVTADRSTDRRLFVGTGAAVAATGTTGVAVVAAVAASPLVLIATPVAVIAGVGVAARGRSRARRTEREIRRLLDVVHDGNGPTRLSVDVARRVAGRTRRT